MTATFTRPRDFHDVLSRCTGVRMSTQVQASAACPCPGHKHPENHLSLTDAGSKCLANCFNRHDIKAIAAALGFVSLQYQRPAVSKAHKGEIQTTYDYVDENGRLLYQAVRHVPKDFSQRRPNGKGDWIWNLNGITRVLYRLPQVLEAVKAGQPVYVVEGEKDADALARLGLCATTSSLGAKKWTSKKGNKPKHEEYLVGASVAIIPDDDEPGMEHAQQVALSLQGKATSIKLVKLPAHHDVSDWLAAGGTREQLEQIALDASQVDLAAMQQAIDDSKATSGVAASGVSALPSIIVNGRQLRDLSDEMLRCLCKYNEPPQLFCRGGRPVRVRTDTSPSYIQLVEKHELTGHLTRVADFHTVDAKGELHACHPPTNAVQDILANPAIPFPSLEGLTESPVVRPDGTLLTTLGYDPATHLYYAPSADLHLPDMPDEPTAECLANAIELILKPVQDFPFDSAGSKANLVAALVSPFLRPMIRGLVPMFVIDKPQAGTGASLLAEIINVTATGRRAAMVSAPKDEEEWRKLITALLRQGQSIVVIDNVDHDLFAPSLAKLLTAGCLGDRILGSSEAPILTNSAIWIATGNNMRLKGDLPRRCIWIRLDAKTPYPWLRDKDKFAIPDLLQWTFDNRADMIAAIMTCIRAWVIAGRPASETATCLGGYEDFCRTMSGLLHFMGVPNFLSNINRLYEELDAETSEWEGFLVVWREELGNDGITTNELINRLGEREVLRSALPDDLADTKVSNYQNRLGKALGRKKDVRTPLGLVLIKAGERNRKALWRVTKNDELL